MAEKMYYTMGEVAEMLDVAPSLIRFWEKQFDGLAPAKNKKGNRLFTAGDVQTVKTIYHLVKERGMTIAGAKKQLKARGASVDRDMELAERLGAIRALLIEVRHELGDGGVVVDDGLVGEPYPTLSDDAMAPATFNAEPEPAVVSTEPTLFADAGTAPVAEYFTDKAECPPCTATKEAIFSTASAGAFAASEQEFATVSDDDEPEYDSNPEFDTGPDIEQEPYISVDPQPAPGRKPEHLSERRPESEPELQWETEPELIPVHLWVPDDDDSEDTVDGGEDPSEATGAAPEQDTESEKSPHVTEQTLF